MPAPRPWSGACRCRSQATREGCWKASLSTNSSPTKPYSCFRRLPRTTRRASWQWRWLRD